MMWQAQWEAPRDGQTQSSGWRWTEEYSSYTRSLHWSWEAGAPTPAGPSGDSRLDAYRIGDTIYLVTQDAAGGAVCISFPGAAGLGPPAKGPFSPDALAGIAHPMFVGAERVDGLSEAHYRYGQDAFVLAGWGQTTGDVWVAAGSGEVIKDVVHWAGSPGIFGSDPPSRTSGQWAWELDEVGQDPSIEAPPGCSAAGLGLPVLGNATSRTTFGDTMTYATPSRLACVVDFYNRRMGVAGWQADPGQDLRAAGLAELTYSKGSQTAQVAVAMDIGAGSTRVFVNVTAEP
jgi:hypothetical protein